MIEYRFHLTADSNESDCVSAIFGLLRQDGGEVSPAMLEKMDSVLAQLGPDGHEIWQQGNVGLGHRLMCFTPEDRFERQPCVGGDRSLSLLCDGRIDNRPELIRMLGLPIAESKILPDSALVLRAYEKWGEQCPDRLIGPFAFVVWSARSQTLFAARSPFSGPPLYYHQATGIFAFSSRPKAIFASGLLKRTIDKAFLADYLVSFTEEPERTFYQGIKLLAPGQCLVAAPSGIKLRTYWQLDQVQPIRLATDDEYVHAARVLLDRVVADQLRSLTPTAILMSGGLDSATIATSATLQLRVDGKDLAAFTEVPTPGGLALAPVAGRYFDETPLVKATAALHDNLSLNFIHGDGFYLHDIDAFFDAAEVPFRNASNRCWMEAGFRGAAAQGRHVMLTGTGGNLSLGRSDDAMLQDALGSGQFLRAFQLAVEMSHTGLTRSVPRALAGALMQSMPVTIRRANNRRRNGWPLLDGTDAWRHYSPITRDLVEVARVAERGRDRGLNFEFAPTLDPRSRRLRSLRHSQLGANIGCGYRELLHVDIRNPAYDQRLVEFSFALPEHQFLHRGVPRALIRRVAAGRVPSAVLTNRQRGLQSAQWLARVQNAQDEIHADLDRFRHSPLVCHALDVPRLQALAQQLPSADAADPQTNVQYRLLFDTGLMTGRFLLWAESGA